MICKAIDYHQVLNMMTKVNWEIKDIMCEHSKYVDYFLQVTYIEYQTKVLFKLNIFIHNILNNK